MDNDGHWSSIGRKPKSFIRECLVEDESQRLTSKQALLHPWFTNKHYAADMEAAYERAIQDWKPRRTGAIEDLIEYIDTRDAALPIAAEGERRLIEKDVKSHHFDHPPPDPRTLYFGNDSLPLPPSLKNHHGQSRMASCPIETASEAQDPIEIPRQPPFYASQAQQTCDSNIPSYSETPIQSFALPYWTQMSLPFPPP